MAEDDPGYDMIINTGRRAISKTDPNYEFNARVEGQIPALMQAGFDNKEIQDWTAKERYRLGIAGFTQDEIDQHLTGVKAPEVAPRSFVQRFLDETSAGKILKSFNEGMNESWSQNLSPEAEKFWSDIGFGPTGPLGFITDPLVKQTARVLQIPGALISGAAAAVGQTGEETGIIKPGEGKSLAADLNILGQIGFTDIGGPEGIQSNLIRGGIPYSKLILGVNGPEKVEVGEGLPKSEDFFQAAQSLKSEDGKWGPKLHEGEILPPEEVAKEEVTAEPKIIEGEAVKPETKPAAAPSEVPPSPEVSSVPVAPTGLDFKTITLSRDVESRLPPVPEGNVRFFRGEGDHTKAGGPLAGQYFANNLTTAYQYAQANKGHILYVDVPVDRITDTFRDIGSGHFLLRTEVVAPSEVPPYVAQKLLDKYEQKGVHPAEAVADAKNDPAVLQDLISDTPETYPVPYKAFQTGVNIDRSKTIPYGAGISKDGKTVYVSSDVPDLFDDPSGNRYDPAQFVIWHEEIERAVMEGDTDTVKRLLGKQAGETLARMKNFQDANGKIPYETAHLEFANPLEKAKVQEAGVDYDSYQKQWNKWLAETEHETADELPADLYEKPYEHDEALIRTGGEIEPTVEPLPKPVEKPVSVAGEEIKLRPEPQEKPEAYLGRVMDEIRARPGANTGRLAKLLGPKLYGEPTNLAAVSVKEMFQNAFDAIKGAMEKGFITKGKIDIEMDPDTRVITMMDNGSGMTPQVLAKEFLEIAGTSKETSQASGGLGIAKMLFLFGNEKIKVTTLRDGTVSTLETSGDQLFKALEDPTLAPNVTVTKKGVFAPAKEFKDGHGTRVEITVPKEFKDPSTGEMKEIQFKSSQWNHDVLRHSPLLADVDVTFNGSTVWNIGSTFQHDDYTQFANVNFDWGTARIYVTKEKVEEWGSNVDVLSNGLWQFSLDLKKNPAEPYGDNVPRHFYVDLSPKVKPEEAGYPFDLNRQGFAKQAKDDFEKIFNYLSALYRAADFADESRSFGSMEYLSKEGDNVVTSGKQEIRPEVPVTETPALAIKEGDKISVVDGKLVVNNREIPELTKEDLANTNIKFDELMIPQDKIDPNKVMLHDNVDVLDDSGTHRPLIDIAREKFGAGFDELSHTIGDVFIRLRDATAAIMKGEDESYVDLLKEAIGVSFDQEYRGVSIRVPFRGSFINIAGSEYKDPVRAGSGIVGTMIHELAHFKERSHNEKFPAEMQRLNINYDANPEIIDLGELKKEVINAIRKHQGVFDWLTGQLDSPGTKTRENRFKEASAYQTRDGRGIGGLGGGGGESEGESGLYRQSEKRKKGTGEEQGSGIVPAEAGGGGGGVIPPDGVGPSVPPGDYGDAGVSPDDLARSMNNVERAISVGELPKRRKFGWSRFMSSMIDELYEVGKAFTKATGEYKSTQELTAEMRPYELFRLLSGTAGKVNHWLRYGALDFNTYKKIGPGLEEIIAPFKGSKALNELRVYLASVQAVDIESKGYSYGINTADARNIVVGRRDLAEVAKQIVNFQNSMVDYAADSGLFTDASRAELKGLNLSFAPYHLVMRMPERVGYASKFPKNIISRLDLAQQKVIDPLETLIRNVYFLVRAAERNEAKKLLIDVLFVPKELSEHLPAVIEPRDVAPTINDATGIALKNFFQRNKIDPSDSTINTLHSFAEEDETDQGHITIFRDGIRETYKVDPELAIAVNNLDRQAANIIFRALGGLTRVKRAGIVLSPSFWMRHLLREPIYGMLTYQPGFFHPGNMIEGLVRGLLSNFGMKDEVWEMYLKSGAAHNSLMALDRNFLQESLHELNAKTGFWDKYTNSAANPIVLARMFLEAVLSSSHYGAFIKAHRKMKRLGMFTPGEIPKNLLKQRTDYWLDQGVSAKEADQFAREDLEPKYGTTGPTKEQVQRLGFISRDTSVDNARIGSFVKSWNMISAFTGATIADSARLVEAFRQNPVKFGFLSAVSIIGSLVYWNAVKDDPRYKDAKRQKKDVNYLFPIGPNYTFNFPKAFGWGILTGTMPEYIAQAIYDQDPNGLSEVGQALFENVVPNFIPDALVSPLEQATNRHRFTGPKIIPTYAEGLVPELRYTTATTETAKALSKILGNVPVVGESSFIAPALVENYVNGMTGTLGTLTLLILDKALRSAGIVPNPTRPTPSLADNPFIRSFFSRYPEAGTQPISDFYNNYNRDKMYLDSWKNRITHGDSAATILAHRAGPEMFIKLDGTYAAINRSAKIIRDVTELPTMKPNEKRQIIDAQYLFMINAAREANKLLDHVRHYKKYLKN